jgi:hypothetical protein
MHQVMISGHITLILLVTGLVTASVAVAVFAPARTLNQLFAKAPSDAISLAITRHWALLVFCIGALLVYAAYHPAAREPVLAAAIAEKIALVLGLFILPLPLRAPAYVAAAFDGSCAALYVLYLAGF